DRWLFRPFRAASNSEPFPQGLRPGLSSDAVPRLQKDYKGLHMKFVSVLLICFVVCTNVSAQTASVAQINGSVKDQSGALLPGVDIKITHGETGYNRSVVSDETGAYILPNLPIGPYRLEASLPGFRTYVQTGIVLQVNSNPTVPIVLAVGAVTEAIQV